jgi:hypothetical protein
VPRLNINAFVRPSGDAPWTPSIEEFMVIANNHEGLFVVESIEYDSVSAGKDNLYFAYCFNHNTGRAIAETLFIVDKIEHYISSSKFVITAQGKEYIVFLKE